MKDDKMAFCWVFLSPHLASGAQRAFKENGNRGGCGCVCVCGVGGGDGGGEC